MSKALAQEIAANFDAFENEWPKELAAAQKRLAPARKKFLESYIRISSIQAWRTAALVGTLDAESEAFFFEAQNDFLTSHCLARSGSFRQALKALRSAIENVYFALYYKDHPIELQKWLSGRHKLGFAELHIYLESHPSLSESSTEFNGLRALKQEYATLSKAVHGSAKAFRMTRDLVEIRLWGDDVPSAAQWATREKAVILSTNLLLIHMFRTDLLGAKNRSLRTSLGLILPASRQSQIKSKLGVTIINA